MKTYLKFNKDLVLEGKYQECEIVGQLPLPILVKEIVAIVDALNKGKWVQIGDFYLVWFNTVTPQRTTFKAESH